MTLQWDRRINYMYLQTNFDLLQAKVKCDSCYSVLRLKRLSLIMVSVHFICYFRARFQ